MASFFLAEGLGLLVKGPKAPSAALQAKSPLQMEPGDDELLARSGGCRMSWGGIDTFRLTAADLIKNAPATPAQPAPSAPAGEGEGGSFDLLHVFLGSEQGIVVVLLLSVLVGAAHALTPGHGKTLVAAYLVGQRGTVGHAFILGLITTITHTGIVLLIALGLLFVDESSRQAVAQSLGLGMGLVLVCLVCGSCSSAWQAEPTSFHLPVSRSPPSLWRSFPPARKRRRRAIPRFASQVRVKTAQPSDPPLQSPVRRGG